jgi:type I site-specific restriction endonuclease
MRTGRDILSYFAPAVQLGLTATPKRKDNVDTYKYFGDPVYIYSLKDGINDGFLTPFKVKQISTTLDEYVCTPAFKSISTKMRHEFAGGAKRPFDAPGPTGPDLTGPLS